MPTTPQNSAKRIHIEPGFAWDGQDAYLFDIDGTLLRDPDRIHMDSFVPSIQLVTGAAITLEGVNVHGNTDTGILNEAFRQAGIPAEGMEPQLAAIRACTAPIPLHPIMATFIVTSSNQSYPS